MHDSPSPRIAADQRGSVVRLVAAALALTLVALTIVAAVHITSEPSHVSAAAAETSTSAPAASTSKNFSPAVQAELKKAMSTPVGRQHIQDAFQKTFGSAARVSVVQDAAPTTAGSGVQPALWCGQVSCGLSSSGGWHFWMIASYAALTTGDLGLLYGYCTAGLAPVLSPFASWAACAGIVGTAMMLVNNWPRYTNHGIWIAVYWWGIQYGRY